MILFVGGEPIKYDGPLSSSILTSWLKEKLERTVTPVYSELQLKELKHKSNFLVVLSRKTALMS